jgi:hypothetical protein
MQKIYIIFFLCSSKFFLLTCFLLHAESGVSRRNKKEREKMIDVGTMISGECFRFHFRRVPNANISAEVYNFSCCGLKCPFLFFSYFFFYAIESINLHMLPDFYCRKSYVSSWALLRVLEGRILFSKFSTKSYTIKIVESS